MSSPVQEIPIDRIRMPKFSLRPLDRTKVDELVQSIHNHGLLQPITVRPTSDGFYELVFGLHRLEAYRKLSLKTITANVRSVDDTDAFLMAEIENLQRNEYVDAVKEGEGFSLLLDKGMTEKEIGERISRSQQYVSARLGLLRLEPDIQTLITSRLVSPEHGYELSKIDDLKLRGILAERSRRDLSDSLTLQQLREAAKKPLAELAREDPRVDAILLRDPVERIRRLEHESTITKQKVELLTSVGLWKRDQCAYFNGDYCKNWSWKRPVIGWIMVQEGDKWRLKVSAHSEYCATCPTYERKA